MIFVFKIKVKESNICTHCQNGNIDTLLHYFYECQTVRLFWEIIGEKYFNHQLTEHNVISGIGKMNETNIDEYVKLNKILLVAKQSIHIYKYGINNQTYMPVNTKLWKKI